MTQEDKNILLKDLCGRLPYGVIVYSKGEPHIQKLIGYIPDIIHYNIIPYLRPLSSMTEDEKKIMRSCGFELISYDATHTGFANIENCIDEVSFRFMEEFLNAYQFDYRGLIPMGLALEAKEGMYEKK